MVRLLTWNCNGLSDERKIGFLRSNFNDLKGVDFALLVETNLSDHNSRDYEGIRDFEITHNVTHSYRQSNDSHAGLCFVISKKLHYPRDTIFSERENLQSTMRIKDKT